MKAKFLFLSSVSVLSALSAYAADTFFFLAPSSGSNVNDMSLWKQLSTYKGGDTFNFYISPKVQTTKSRETFLTAASGRRAL